jgi:hypothetical protein
MHKTGLPFPRGETLAGSVVTPDADYGLNLVGKIYEVYDERIGNGQYIKLRVVKNHSGSAITAARKLYRYGTGAGDWGRMIAGLTNAAGQECSLLDDAYKTGTSIASHDLFYVVEEGWGHVLSSTNTAQSLSAHDELQAGNRGVIVHTAAEDDDFVFARADAAITTTNTAAKVYCLGLGGRTP